MELQRYIDEVREQVLLAAESGGEASRAVAERLTAPLDSALRLALLESLSAAADEITLELAPGSVEVRLRGREPEFAVSLPAEEQGPPAVLSAPTETDEAGTARITLRLSEALKVRVEEAAGREGLSVNAWLNRALAAATDRNRPAAAPAPASGRTFTGWVH